jgi:hypothetical protein
LAKGFFNKIVYHKLQRVKVKKKMIKVRMTNVIKEITIHPHHWMNNLSYHLRSPKIYSNIVLNTHCHFVSQGAPLLLKISHLTTMNPIVLYGINKSHVKGKRSFHLSIKMSHLTMKNPNSST